MDLFVTLHVVFESEGFSAILTLVLPFSGVNHFVSLELLQFFESFSASFALERPFVSVIHHMDVELFPRGRLQAADRALHVLESLFDPLHLLVLLDVLSRQRPLLLLLLYFGLFDDGLLGLAMMNEPFVLLDADGEGETSSAHFAFVFADSKRFIDVDGVSMRLQTDVVDEDAFAVVAFQVAFEYFRDLAEEIVALQVVAVRSGTIIQGESVKRFLHTGGVNATFDTG